MGALLSAPAYTLSKVLAERFRLDDRHVVVLGAGQGIGREAARGAAELGARVTCVDFDAERAEAVPAQVGGSFVFVSSISGMGPSPLHTGYGAAKAALISLVASEAVRLAPLGVRVNAVAPMLIATPRMRQLLGEAGRAQQASRLAMGRVGGAPQGPAGM